MELHRHLVRIPQLLLDLLFPQICFGCGREGTLLCDSCSERLQKIKPPLCIRCGFPMDSRSFCPDCHSQVLAIDGIRSLYYHEGLARDLVHSLKYRHMKGLAKPLAMLMVDILRSNPMNIDTLVAVPVHPRRLRRRGYNQSDLLAEHISRALAMGKISGALTRIKDTPPQVTLSAEERRKNVLNAFHCKQGAFENRNVLLIDDVCTTGSTLNACAVALKDAGAASVWGLTLSREC